MSLNSAHSRRDVIRILAGAPMLPLATGFLPVFLSGEAGALEAAHFVTARFTSMPAPTLADAAGMATTNVGSALTVTMSDKSSYRHDLGYEPFFVTGDMVPDGKGGTILAGGYVDIHNKPIVDGSVPSKERQFFSDSPDGSSLLVLPGASVDGVNGKPVFAVVQFEYTTADLSGADTYGQLPSPIAVLTLDQDQTTGKLRLVKYHNVDTSPANGLWITCGASLSPWNTHLSSEEYEPDAAFIDSNKQFKAFSKNLFGDASKANPYHYGHLPEVIVNPDGTGKVIKHYNVGRLSHELVQVMPDNRTVLLGDDATNSGLFLFIADKERDLSAGTLFVAKVGAGFSIDPAAPGADLTWIKIGHATSDEIKQLADSLKPSDIMTVLREDPNDPSFKKIFASGVANWVKIKPGMEKAAAFLETHRYAYLAGGSMGFTKMEGTTVNAKDKVAYSALQNVVDSMVKGGKGWNEGSNVTVEKPLVAGCILAHTLTGGQKDTSGDAMNSEWVPVHTKALLAGKDIPADELGNLADPNMVANPDNLKFSETLRTLFIGEDSATHVNNFLWAYNVDTKELARILSTPAGAESTGLHAVDSANGWTYIMSNFQHPGEWLKALHGKVQTTLDPLVRANYKDRYGAAVGYLTAKQTAIKL
jgi:secreted PhoX family phosphatase